MLTLREAAQQALEALKLWDAVGEQPSWHRRKERQDAITALKAALAEPVQEPYAWMAVGGSIWRHKTSEDDVPLYIAPPQRKPLTDEEIKEIFLRELGDLAVRIPPGWRKVVSAIERAHQIGGQDE